MACFIAILICDTKHSDFKIKVFTFSLDALICGLVPMENAPLRLNGFGPKMKKFPASVCVSKLCVVLIELFLEGENKTPTE